MTKEKQTESQKKRIATLREKGLYHEPDIREFVCSRCGERFSYDINAKHLTKYFKSGFCSDKCYRESGQKQKDKRLTELRNMGYTDITNENFDEMYTKMLSERTTKSYDKWIDSHKKKGEDFFVKRGLNSVASKHDHFLVKNGIISEDECQTLSDDVKTEMYRKHFNEITKHGEKIKQGRINKHGGLEGYVDSYVKGRIKAIKRYMRKYVTDIEIDSLNDEEYINLISEWSHKYAYHCQNKSRDNKSKIRFKKTHLINQCGLNESDVEAMSDEEVEKRYSEYLSHRKTHLEETTENGYQHTKKGFFSFVDGTLFFYRSSWEMDVCNILNDLMIDGIVTEVSCPPKLNYYFVDKEHSYFPDFLVKYADNFELTIEVKPFRKKNEPMNVAKFESARKKIDNFIILTENEIYSDKIILILKEHLYVDN